MDSPIQAGQQVNVTAQLIITLTQEGQIVLSMNGEVNKIMGFGLIEIGRQSLEQWFKQQEERKVQPVSFLPPGGFRA